MALDRMIEGAQRRLFLPAAKRVLESDAYATVRLHVPRIGRRRLIEGIDRALDAYAQSGELPKAFSNAVEGVEQQPSRLQRRLSHLTSLLIRTQGEEQELERLRRTEIVPAEPRPWYRRIFGRKERQPPEESRRSTSEQGEGVYRPLERIAEDAARVYNVAVKAGRLGDNQALHRRYRLGASLLGLEEETYKDALREHVRQAYEESEALMAARYGGPLARKRQRTMLSRFDRRLLPGKEAYARETLDLYVNSDLSLREIAERQSEKYGMRVSASTISRIARQRLAATEKQVASRTEAKERYGYDAWKAGQSAQPAT